MEDKIQNQVPVFAPIPAPVGNPIGGGIINAIAGFITKGKKEDRPKLKKRLKELAGAESVIDKDYFGEELSKGFESYNKQLEIADSALSSRNKTYTLDNPISVLSAGKFQGVKITREMVNDAVMAARKYKIDPMDILAIMGQESTFSQSRVPKEKRDLNQRSMTSGWTTSEPYEPYKPERFLADKQVPGVVEKYVGFGNKRKRIFSIENMELVKEAIKRRPGLMQQYIKKVEATPIAEENYIDMAARFVKNKGLKNYNPNDKNYVSDVMNSKALLQKDPALMKYLRSIKL